MSIHTYKAADKYVPTYFLGSVGAGGLAVTFFMYLMFWVPHPGKPVPVFEDIRAAFETGTLPLKAAIIVAALGIAVFAFMNIKALIWNLGQLSKFKQTEAYTKLRNSNGETTLLAAPLAVAMSINASFIVGLVFVPQLWSIVEYLFPMAMVAFALTGVWAVRLIGDFLGRALAHIVGLGKRAQHLVLQPENLAFKLGDARFRRRFAIVRNRRLFQHFGLRRSGIQGFGFYSFWRSLPVFTHSRSLFQLFCRSPRICPTMRAV